MKQEEKEIISQLVDMYGVYEVTKVLRDIAAFASEDYKSQGNTGAIIHKDALALKLACYDMATSHPLRSKDVP